MACCLCVCLMVCLCVCFLYSVFLCFYASNERYQQLHCRKCSKTKKWFSLKLLSSKVRSVINLLRLYYKSAIFFMCIVSIYLSVTRTRRCSIVDFLSNLNADVCYERFRKLFLQCNTVQ